MEAVPAGTDVALTEFVAGSLQAGPGKASVSGNRVCAGPFVAAITCQWGAVPCGPRFRRVPGAPKVHSADRMIIQPNHAVAITKYPIRGPNTAARSTYTLPMNRMIAEMYTAMPLANVGASASAACPVIWPAGRGSWRPGPSGS